jgi:hypothetical protein
MLERKLMMRVSIPLIDKIKAEAKRNCRTMGGQIVFILQTYFNKKDAS